MSGSAWGRGGRPIVAPLDAITEADLSAPEVEFQIGVVPNRVDILTAIEAVDFDPAWANRTPVRVMGVEALERGR